MKTKKNALIGKCILALVIGWILIFFFSPVTYAQPIIHSITPDSGPPGTEVTIQGESFQSGAKVALYGGGPDIAGSVDTPGYAQGVQVSGSYAYMAEGEPSLQVVRAFEPCTNVTFVDSTASHPVMAPAGEIRILE